MTRPDDEFPPLDVTSTLNLGSLDEVLEGPDTDVVPSRMSGSLPPGMALLVVRRGPNAGARFLLDHDVTTSGRHPDSDIFLDDVTVSRRHAEFHRDAGVFTVRDVGSLSIPRLAATAISLALIPVAVRMPALITLAATAALLVALAAYETYHLPEPRRKLRA